MATRTPFKWNTANFAYDNGTPFPNQSASPFTWDDVALVEEVVQTLGGAGGEDPMYPLFREEPEKRKKLIKLICTVKGKKYTEEKEIGQIKVTAKDIQLLEEKVLGININVKL